MISTLSSVPEKTRNTFTFKRYLSAFAGLLAVGAMVAGTQAKADPVHFTYNGGRWSHSYHSGWHRYWGGPSTGYYYAPAPVYVVPGYSRATYYSGPDFWYSNPSFGLNINLGGGGHYRPYYSRPTYYHRTHYVAPVRRWHSTGGHYTHVYRDRYHR